MPDDETQPAPLTADKCGDMPHEETLRLGGAHTFGDAEAYRTTQQIDMAVYDLWSTFDDLRYNMQHDDELTNEQQAALVADLSQQMAARLVAVPTDVAAGKETGLIDRVKQVGRTIAHALNPQPPAVGDPTGDGSFVITKDLAGNWRWLAIASNNFKDRDGEYFPETAHLDYVDYVDQTADYPELRLWHVKGTRLGMADFVCYADHFLLASGTFDTESEHLAPVMADKQYGVSHGFRYREQDKQGDTYTRYRSFEISALPPDRAANPWTAFGTMESIKEVAMLPEAKKQFVLDHLGPERTAVLEAKLADAGKELEGLGISFKEIDTAAAPPAPAAPVAAPAANLDVAAPVAAAPVAAVAADPSTPKPPNGDGEEGGGDNGDGDAGTGEGNGDGEAEGSAELVTMLKALAGLPTVLANIETRLAAIEGDKAAVDATPAAAAVIGQTRPSQSDATAVDGDKAKAIETLIGENTADKAPSNPVVPYMEQVFGPGVVVN